MNTTEAILLLRKVKAHCPSQAIDEYTGEAWAEALDDIRYTDANAALIAIAKQPLELGRYRYIEPGHIRGEVNRQRGRRLEAYGAPDIPNGLPDENYHEYVRLAYRAAGDGTLKRGDPTPTLDELRQMTNPDGIRELTGGAA